MGLTVSPSSAQKSRSSLYRVFGDRPFCTDGDLAALCFASDGTLWSLEEPGVLRRWDASNGLQLAWYPLTEMAMVWACSPDGRYLASGNDELTLWDVAAGEPRETLEQPSWVTAVAFRPDGQVVATGHDDGVVRVWDVANGSLLREYEGHSLPVSALAFRLDGQRLASAGEDKLIALWDESTGEAAGRLIGHSDRIPALVWHPDGRRLFSAGWDTTARVWDTESCEPIILLNSHASQVFALALSPDGRFLASADSGNALHIWDTAVYRPIQVFKAQEGEARCLAFSPDGRMLASGGSDRVIRLWDPQRGALRAGPAEAIVARESIAVSRDGNQVAEIGAGTALRIWDTATAESIREQAEGEELHVVAYSPDGRFVATGGERGIALWDAISGALVSRFEEQATPVTALAFAPGGNLLATVSATGGDVWLWDLAKLEPALIIPDAAGGCIVQALAFHPEELLLAVGGVDWLATSGSDGAVALWDITARRQLARFSGGTTSLAFDPTGRLLAGAALGDTVQVWEISSGQLATELEGHEETVTGVAFSPDGRWLASGSDDHTIRLWDVATWHCAAETRLDTQVKALAFSPDGRFLYTGNGNTSCYQVDLTRLLP